VNVSKNVQTVGSGGGVGGGGGVGVGGGSGPSTTRLSKFVCHPFVLAIDTVLHGELQPVVIVSIWLGWTGTSRWEAPLHSKESTVAALPPLYASRLTSFRGVRKVNVPPKTSGPLNPTFLLGKPKGPDRNHVPLPQSITWFGYTPKSSRLEPSASLKVIVQVDPGGSGVGVGPDGVAVGPGGVLPVHEWPN
jgi:hypothetical protein